MAATLHTAPTMLALLLTLLSSVSWATFDVTRKLLVRRVDVLAVACLVNLIQVPGFVLWASSQESYVQRPYLLYASGSLAVNVAANVMFLLSVARSELSRTVPLLGLTPAFSLAFGALALGELPSTRQLFGIGVVVVGAMLLSVSPQDLKRPWRVLSAPLRAPGGAWMIGVALCWSLAPVLDKLALGFATAGVHGVFLSAGVASLLGLGLLLRPGRQHFGPALSASGLFTVSGMAALLALGTQLLAVQIMAVSLFEGLKRAVGMLASVLGGRLFFSEPITRHKTISVVLMIVGVMLLV